MSAVEVLPPLRGRAVVAARRSAARARSLRAGAGLALAMFLVFALSVSIGDFPIPVLDVVPAIFGFGDDGAVFVAQELRLPRALGAVLVGAAFGVSGAIFQAVARNPLASPDVLGILAGGSLAAVFAIITLDASYVVMATCAFGGSLAITILIYVLAYRRGVTSYRFVLVGIGIGSAAVALTSYMVTQASLFEAAEATVWMTGSLNGTGWETIVPLAIGLAVLVPLAVGPARTLRALQLGDDTARSLGLPLERARAGIVLIAVALAGAGAAAVGPLSFVALLAAPIARRLTGSPLALIPAALTGALIVLAADLVGRRLFAPTELPAGIFTGLCGAPYFLWLLARANRTGAGG